MILAGSFFDTNGNGWDIADIAALLGLLLTLGAVIVLVRKSIKAGTSKFASEIREIVRDELDVYTKPIQKGANGGSSLPDVNRKVDLIAQHLGIELPVQLQVKD